jgi:hypothetical protein
MAQDHDITETQIPQRGVLGWSPFHVAAEDYYRAGYLPIPLPGGHKGPPPNGTPNEVEVDEEQISDWLDGRYRKKNGEEYRNNRDCNIGTIVPDGVLVIDVDGTAALEALRELEGTYGALPRTWMSFRGNPDRFHMWFSTPVGLAWPGRLAPGIDIIYRHYRYMVLPPSVHPDGGQYRWANMRKEKLRSSPAYFPGIDEFTDLPDEWLELADGNGFKQRDRSNVDSRLWIQEHGMGVVCPEMKRAASRIDS